MVLKEVELRLKPSRNWVSDLQRESPTTIRILDCKPGKGDSVQQLIEINTPGDDLDEKIGEIRSSSQVADVYLTKTRRGRGVGRVLSQQAKACRSLMETDGFCRSCLFTSMFKEDGTAEWTVAFSDGKSLNEFISRLEDQTIEVEIVRLSRIIDKKNLTARQEQVIRHALERGYFDYPRRTDLLTLGKELAVSKSTIGEILRRAEKKGLASLYGRNGYLS